MTFSEVYNIFLKGKIDDSIKNKIYEKLNKNSEEGELLIDEMLYGLELKKNFIEQMIKKENKKKKNMKNEEEKEKFIKDLNWMYDNFENYIKIKKYDLNKG